MSRISSNSDGSQLSRLSVHDYTNTMIKQHESETAYVVKPCQGQYGLDPESVRIRIRTLDPDYLKKLTWTSLSWLHLHKIFMKSDHSLPRYKPNCSKISLPYLATLKNPSKKIPGSASGGSRLPKFNRFFLVHRYTSGKIVMKICLVVLRKVANRQTDKQEQSQTASRPPRRMWSGSGVHGSGVRIRIRT